MIFRRRGHIFLFLILLGLAGCDGEQYERGIVPDPYNGDEFNTPDWAHQNATDKPRPPKNPALYRTQNSTQPPPRRVADIATGQINDTTPGSSKDSRISAIAPEVEKPFRYQVPPKGKAAAEKIADAAPLPIAEPVELPPAEPVDLQAQAQRDLKNSISARVDTSMDTPAATQRTATQRTAASQARDGDTAKDIAASRDASYARPGAGTSVGDAAAVREATSIARTGAPADDEVEPRRALSPIERLYNSTEGLSRGKRLEQFGYKTFAGGVRAESNAQIDPEFVIGAGDEIHVKSLDGFIFDKVLVVERDGTIAIDEVGTIRVASLRAKDVTETIRAAIANAGKKNFRLNVSFGKLHAIRIQVAGLVKRPGLMLSPANSTLMEALTDAGGPTKDGTLRDVVLQRAGQPAVHIDLYGVLASENAAADVVLLAGDRIFVGPIGPTVGIMGPSGSGIFELKGKDTVAGVMRFVGRINSFTQLDNVQVERSFGNARREVQVIDYTRQAASFAVQDGDVIAFNQINGYLNEIITVKGAVVRPQSYPFKPGMKVSDVIRMAGGFLLDASLDRALIQRPLGNTSQYDVMPGDKSGNLREEAIWVDLAALLTGKKEADLTLQRLDTLKIFSVNEAQDTATVKIIGGVRKPGNYKLTAGLTLGDLIRLAGGPTPDAFAGESTIVRRKRAAGDLHMDVEIIPFRLDEVQRHLADYDFLLENQDQVVIKRVTSMQVTVRIGGRVPFPGTHVLPDGSKLSDLVQAAGGVMSDADLRAAIFTRKRIQQLQQARLDELFTRMEQIFSDGRNRVVRDGRNNEGIAAHLAYLGLGNLTTNIERFQARGRLVINLLSPTFLTSHDNVTLEDGDELYLPRRENIVMVLGEVNNPTAFVMNHNSTVADYLDKAGGFLPEADKKQVYVVMSNGEVYSDANKRIFGGSVSAFRPGPGDTILVPKTPPKRSKLATASDITLLIRQLAETGLVTASIPQAFAPNHPANVSLGIGNSVQSPPDIIENQSSSQFYEDTRKQSEK